MKSKMIRLLSLMLMLALLVSCLGVLVYAEGEDPAGTTEEPEQEEESPIDLLLYRSFDEGWDFTNGLPYSNATKKDGDFKMGSEQIFDNSYNYFWALHTTGVQDSYVDMTGNSGNEYVVLQFDVKSEDICTAGNLYTRVPTGYQGPTVYLYGINNGKFCVPDAGTYTSGGAAGKVVATLSNEWFHIAYCFHLPDVAIKAVLDADKKIENARTAATDAEQTYHDGGETEELKAAWDAAVADLEAAQAERDAAYVAAGGRDTYTDQIEITMYYGPSIGFDINDPTTYQSHTTRWTKSSGQDTWSMTGFEMFRFGVPAGAAGRDSTYCLDNIAYYIGADKPLNTEDVAALGTGTLVADAAEKVIEIKTNKAGGKTTEDYLNDALCMKVGSDYCLIGGERRGVRVTDEGVAYGAPVVVNGKTMVALETLLEQMNYPIYIHQDGISYDISTGKGASYITIGRDTAAIDGVSVKLSTAPVLLDDGNGNRFAAICIDDIERLFNGFYLTYDDMGLIIVSEKDEVVNRKDDLALMTKIMKKFLFDNPTSEDIYDDVKANTNNFTHPYIFANQASFDKLNKVYTDKNDTEYLIYINAVLDQAKEYYNGYAKVNDGEYAGIKEELLAKGATTVLDGTGDQDADFFRKNLLYNIYNTTNYGYNPVNGSAKLATGIAERMSVLALAYQITREVKYAKLAYDLAVQLGTWASWGEASIADCAATTAAYAEAFDWCYNVWTELGYDVDAIAQNIYDFGVSKAYISLYGNIRATRMFNGKNVIDASFTKTEDSINAITTSGMVIGALATLEYCGDGKTLEVNQTAYESVASNISDTAAGQVFETLGTLLYNLNQYGLEEYAPDGAYIESTGKWSLATNSIFKMAMALESATGSDYGFMNTWGLNTTCYFALYTEYPTLEKNISTGEWKEKIVSWAFNEAPAGTTQDKSSFYYAGVRYNDEVLIAARRQQILKGATPNMLDLLFFDPSFESITEESITIGLDYYATNLALFASRSSWESGCLYAGMMGGPNSMNRGQIDVGNFVYANANYEWLCDLGSDNESLYNYYADDAWRYRYYRVTGEGQNVLLLTGQPTAIPYGQKITGSGVITKTLTNEFGSVITMNTQDCYGDYVAYSNRGMFVTNNRTAVIIQDEMAFKGVQTFAWVAHTKASIIHISADGSKAYLKEKINGEDVVIRLSVVATISDAYKFEVVDSSDKDGFLLNTIDGTTKDAENSKKYNGLDENDRSAYKTLLIKRSGASCELAVVIERVESEESGEIVGYSYTPMNEWVPTKDAVIKDVDQETEPPKAQWILDYYTEASEYIDEESAFSYRYDEFFSAMHNVYAAVEVYGTQRRNIRTTMKDVYAAWEDYEENGLPMFETFMEEVAVQVALLGNISDALCGFGR